MVAMRRVAHFGVVFLCLAGAVQAQPEPTPAWPTPTAVPALDDGSTPVEPTPAALPPRAVDQVLLTVAADSAPDTTVFPRPAILAPNVAFWTEAFSNYSEY